MTLLEQFHAANDAEGVAIKILLAYLQNGGRDKQKLKELRGSQMEAHNKKMDILDKLQPK